MKSFKKMFTRVKEQNFSNTMETIAGISIFLTNFIIQVLQILSKLFEKSMLVLSDVFFLYDLSNKHDVTDM